MPTDGEKLSLLVVGSLPPPVGGCSVTLQYLVDELRRRSDVSVQVVDTRGIRGEGWRGAARFGAALTGLLRGVRGADVVTLHVATTAVPTWGLVVLAVSRLAGRAFVLRKFAATDYRALGFLRGRLAHVVASQADAYLVETQAHLAASRERHLGRARWFPTTRPAPPARPAGREDGRCRRFVYVGHVSRLKGIDVLVRAMAAMPPGASLDVYGPLVDGLTRADLEASPTVAYHGPIAADEVVATLARYDAFVLPTTATTEGYPGTVLEAYRAGLPVIASRVGAIPEIVDATTGVLVEPGDAAALTGAMARLFGDADAYRALSRAAAEKAGDFGASVWCDRFVGYCREAVGLRRGARA